jgi:hypothetical protein
MAEPFKLKLPPGLVRGLQSDYATEGRYYDANFVRWDVTGSLVIMKPMGGFDVANDADLLMEGKARAAHAWLDDDEQPVCMIGTTTRLYAKDASGALHDITPVGFDPGATSVGTWTLDNFGELGVACHSEDGVIYEWQPNGGMPATPITNAPTARAIYVTDEKFLVALAVNGDPRTRAWCDQVNRTVWTATAINQAGDLPINEVGRLMCGAKVKGGSLDWTTEGVHYYEYLGPPNVYGGEQVSSGCGIVSRHAKATFGSQAWWMGDGQFFTYRGVVVPLFCDIADDVFGNMNQDHKHKVWCLHNARDGEVWWPYPRGSATECSHAAIYCYKGKPHWNHTEFPRLAGFDRSVFGYPAAVSSEGRLMRHETGWDYEEKVFLLDDDGETLLTDEDGTYLTDDPGALTVYSGPFARTGPIEIGNGDRRMLVDEFIPDGMNVGSIGTIFHLRDAPDGALTTIGPYSSAARVGVLMEGRQVSVEYRANENTEDWRVGIWRVKASARGRY